MERRPTVLIAEDHVLYRRGLRELLEPTFDVVAEATEGNEAIMSAIKWRPDVVTMDIAMPGMDGLAATRLMKVKVPTAAVVLITSSSDRAKMIEAIEAGATSLVQKDDDPSDLLSAISAAAKGTVWLPPSVTQRLLSHVAASLDSSDQSVGQLAPGLSPRESDVLRLIGSGHANQEIAGLLSLSLRTVGCHITSIHHKLGITSRAQTIRYAISKGLVQLDPAH